MIKHEPSPATERVLMWRMRRAAREVWLFGALEDGTIFQKLPASVWSTLTVGPGADTAAATEFVMAVTAAAESRGAALEVPPVEFGLDARIVTDIRGNANWQQNEPMILIAFDMATKAGRR